RLLDTAEGNTNPKAYHEVWRYASTLQRRYEHLEALRQEEQEEDIFPMEEDPEDHSYHRVFIPERFLNVPKEDLISEPSDENQTSLIEYFEGQ
ncbi:hypothetical protein KI387_019824, partial [Taxus chinensis]